MRSTLFLGAAAALAMIAVDPALCMQASQPMPQSGSMQTPPDDPSAPDDPMDPAPAPTPDPATPPQPQPMPPEMPMQAPTSPMAPPTPTMGSTDSPTGSMATSPDSGAISAQSGGTNSAMRQPVAATKEYPPCSKMLQDNCRNRGEGPKRR